MNATPASFAPSELATTRSPRASRRPLLAAASGLITLIVGVACVIRADLGVASWDTLSIGLSLQLGVTVGTAVTLTGVVVAAGAALLFSLRPTVTTVAIAVTFGPLLNAALALIPAARSMPASAAMLAVGCVAIGVGVGTYTAAGVGFGPHDAALGVLLARGMSAGRAKLAVDVTVTALGFVLGGPVGAGSIVVLVVPSLVVGRVRPYMTAWLVS
jgi:uncharacterized membrane protein YczE